ncbi:MAG: UPF0149 family protein [Pseudomonadales bacterium]|nr:UPF0149 family protein [Pseudomonadales bacterium]
MSNTAKALDFDEVANLMVSLSASITPSEVHGLLAGQLAAGKRMDKSSWFAEAKTLLDIETNFSPDQQEQLLFIYMATFTQIGDAELGFYPLIPDDDLEFNLRLQCLGLWCSGFLAGFALIEKKNATLPELVNDALNDLAAISQVGANEDEELDESAESDFFQIIEYIRLAAMNIFIEYAAEADAQQVKPAANTESFVEGKSTDNKYLGSEQLFTGRKVH